MWKALVIFLIPLMLSNALQSLSNTIGSVIIGRFLGVHDLAAMSAFFPVFFFLISFMIGIGSGSSVLIGQAFGAQKMDRLKAVAGTTLTFTFLVGFVLGMAGVAFTAPVLSAMGTPASVLAASIHFGRIMFASLPVLFVYAVYTTFLNGTGDSRTPFYFLVVSTVLGSLIGPALIFGWLGLPRLGLVGAAWGNLWSTLLTLALLILYLHVRRHPLRVDAQLVRNLRIDLGLLRTLLKIGIPTGVQMIMVTLSEIAIVSLVNRFGADATAAYGAYYQVANYVQMPAVSIGIAASVFGSQIIGAGVFERLKPLLRAATLVNYAVGGVLVALCYVFARDILALFLTSRHTLDIAYELLMITLWSYLVFGNAAVLSGIMRSSGIVFWPTLLSILAIWVIEIPVAFVLSGRIGIDGVWVGYCAGFVANLGLQYAYYRLVWRHKRLTRLIH
ncbi:MATE family efflux transporter [Alicyclobacillus cellulosilyticus]|uniref:MATE family efflux transporter n=1 Tax=Alicyclobacillus cellulosilyticus TaxID=1003997 RepID=UPI001E5B9E7A|nr:MATE family efflux transporter [Alicyclobacillus cellulosilyticus]